MTIANCIKPAKLNPTNLSKAVTTRIHLSPLKKSPYLGDTSWARKTQLSGSKLSTPVTPTQPAITARLARWYLRWCFLMLGPSSRTVSTANTATEVRLSSCSIRVELSSQTRVEQNSANATRWWWSWFCFFLGNLVLGFLVGCITICFEKLFGYCKKKRSWSMGFKWKTSTIFIFPHCHWFSHLQIFCKRKEINVESTSFYLKFAWFQANVVRQRFTQLKMGFENVSWIVCIFVNYYNFLESKKSQIENSHLLFQMYFIAICPRICIINVTSTEVNVGFYSELSKISIIIHIFVQKTHCNEFNMIFCKYPKIVPRILLKSKTMTRWFGTFLMKKNIYLKVQFFQWFKINEIW